MQSRIFSVAKRSQNPENSTYTVWFVREAIGILRPDLRKEGFCAIMRRKYEV